MVIKSKKQHKLGYNHYNDGSNTIYNWNCTLTTGALRKFRQFLGRDLQQLCYCPSLYYLPHKICWDWDSISR